MKTRTNNKAFAFILLVFCVLITLFSMGCEIPESVVEAVENEIEDDFILTIWAENTTVKQGEGFEIYYGLKNNSGKDQEIILPNIQPHIMPDVVIDGPIFYSDSWKPQIFEVNSVLPNEKVGAAGVYGFPWKFGRILKPGIYELRFSFGCFLNWRQEDEQWINVSSNLITLTVVR